MRDRNPYFRHLLLSQGRGHRLIAREDFVDGQINGPAWTCSSSSRFAGTSSIKRGSQLFCEVGRFPAARRTFDISNEFGKGGKRGRDDLTPVFPRNHALVCSNAEESFNVVVDLIIEVRVLSLQFLSFIDDAPIPSKLLANEFSSAGIG
jgi:hypothetical protein